MVDLKLDEMYAAGALNTYIDELTEWIREKEASIAKRKDKAYLLPVIDHLEKHIEYVRSLLSEAENYRSKKKDEA